ncbi:MAG: PIN domain-containing protein [Proteobacteria bacterium]|nr:PIN domain-containing protein [Pseudomonadota bacterium]
MSAHGKDQPKGWKAFHYIHGPMNAQATPGTAPIPLLILDSNTLFDWLVFAEPAACAVGAAAQAGTVRWLCSEPLWAEWVYTLARPIAARWEPARQLALANLDTPRRWATFAAQPAPAPLRCLDGDDQKFLDLALAHPGSALLTRDKALLRLARRAALHGVRITSATTWVRECPH